MSAKGSHESERVLVVPTSVVFESGKFQGFSADAESYLNRCFRPGVARFLPRSDVETDPSLKQLIPYVVFRHEDTVFCYRRGTSQGEARLHAKRSLGVGGHVSEDDAQGEASWRAYLAALDRELAEEVELQTTGPMRLAGLINDDSTAVGSVHLGVVHIYDLVEPHVRAREDGLADAGFLSLEDVLSARDEFETWSQIVIDSILEASVEASEARSSRI
jgi:predicted NUDIX family phosphoesterase